MSDGSFMILTVQHRGGYLILASLPRKSIWDRISSEEEIIIWSWYSLFMHDNHDIDDHHDDYKDEHYDSYHPLWWDASPRNLSFNFGAKIACAYFASGQSMTIRHWVIFHHLATFGGRWLEKGVWFLKGAKKHWFFIFLSRHLFNFASSSRCLSDTK